MMQIENEVGVLGDTRDHSDAANKAFRISRASRAHRISPISSRRTLSPTAALGGSANGARTTGAWAEVFGDTPRADEIFMAWNYARFIQQVTAAGKAAYDIPMYVNTWLAGDDDTPGSYPSGCPEPWVVDVWKAAGSSNRQSMRPTSTTSASPSVAALPSQRQPLYMPEATAVPMARPTPSLLSPRSPVLGFSPFGIDNEMDAKGPLADTYRLL